MAQAQSGTARWGFRLGLVGAVAFVIGPILAHFHVLPAIGGFALFGLGGLLGIIALILAAVGAVRGGVGVGLALGAAVTIAFFAIALPGRKYPRINDITTDPANPPQFVKAGSLEGNQGRDMKYPGPSFAEQQHAGYPSLAALRLSASPDDAFRRVESAAKQTPDWELTRDDPSVHILEGVATSSLFQFKDDFVVEVRSQDSSSVVQMRSKSRDGQGDIGANAARIEAFFATLR